MTEALAAHLRLLERLRDRTRTHRCEAVPQRSGAKYCGKKRIGLLERLKKCEALGMTRQEMAFQCGTSSKTIVRLLGICGYRGRKITK